MRKLFIILLFFPLFCHAQFTLTPNGFIDSSSKKDYVVFNFPGQSASSLYESASKAILTNGFSEDLNKNSSNVANIEGEIITLMGVGHIQIRRLMVFDYKVKYTLILRFRDGRIRFDAPIIRDTYTYNGYGMKCTIDLQGSDASTSGSTIHVFKSDGELKEKKIKSEYENLFNEIISKICNSITSDNEEW